MKTSDLKYLLAYIPILSAYIAVSRQGYLSYLTVAIAFVLIPLLERILPHDKEIVVKEVEINRAAHFGFDVMLYMNVPLVLGLVIFTISNLSLSSLSTFESIGIFLSVGIALGASGINVAHELGHRQESWDKFCSRVLLTPCLYLHFTIEHNRGHHLRVATPEDAATARKDENLFFFLARSIVTGYLSAWRIAHKDNKELLKNEMLHLTCIQVIYLLLVFGAFGCHGLLIGISIGVISFLTLETINYIEHYGLLRNKMSSGKYERIAMRHSWNSDHKVGRILLYELTRHSDHHYKTTRPYQILRSFDESPQLPLGYPGSMLLALIPPLWFKIMNPLVPQESNSSNIAE